MSVQVVVTTGKEETPRQAGLIRQHGEAGKTGKVQVNINELITSVFESVRGSLEKEADVEIELTGNLSLTGKEDDYVLMFDVSGENPNARTLRVKLNTKIKPSEEEEKKK